MRRYRYGFNGKEKDESGEWGELTHYDYGFRIYNPGIGRFLSVDPLAREYPWYTPYQFAGNKPIWAIDLDGLEEWQANLNDNDVWEVSLKQGTSKEIEFNIIQESSGRRFDPNSTAYQALEVLSKGLEFDGFTTTVSKNAARAYLLNNGNSSTYDPRLDPAYGNSSIPLVDESLKFKMSIGDLKPVRPIAMITSSILTELSPIFPEINLTFLSPPISSIIINDEEKPKDDTGADPDFGQKSRGSGASLTSTKSDGTIVPNVNLLSKLKKDINRLLDKGESTNVDIFFKNDAARDAVLENLRTALPNVKFTDKGVNKGAADVRTRHVPDKN